MSLQQRIADAIREFELRHPEYGDTTVVGCELSRSNRGRGPGTCAIVRTECGMSFEVVLQHGDDVRAVVSRFVQVQ